MSDMPLTPAVLQQQEDPKAARVRRLAGRRFLAAVALLAFLGALVSMVYPHAKAWYHLRAARLALKQYHNPEAIEHLQICLKTWPNDADALLLAARIARRAGNYVEADIALSKYEAQRGVDEAAEIERVLLRAENGDVDRAAAFCKRWIEQGHRDAPFIFEAMAHAYLHTYRLPDVRLLLQRWRQDQPGNPQVDYVEGELHDCEGVSEAAVASYQRVLQLDPEHDDARFKLTAALMEQRGFAQMEPHLEHLLRRQPDNLQVVVRLAVCRAFLGRVEEAVRLLDDVLARDPDFAPALAERGRIALERGEYPAAEKMLRKAVEGNPSDHASGFRLVQCLQQSGKVDEAQKQEQQLKQLEADLKRIDEIANRSMAETPYDPALHCELGTILLRCGFVEPGLHWLNTALSRDPRCSAAHQALAQYYKRIGASEQAEHHRRLADLK
jgi:tetratricopeptide (TPR) repeat protein